MEGSTAPHAEEQGKRKHKDPEEDHHAPKRSKGGGEGGGDDAASSVSALLVDIEGTTTPLDFVSGTLFPYIRKHLAEYLKANWTSKECQEDVEELRKLSVSDAAKKVEGHVAVMRDGEGEEAKVQQSVVDNVLWQMDSDRKSTELKRLQGHIWRKGYETGELQGWVYRDVVEAFSKWSSKSVPVYIYSSGSIAAQILLFKYSNHGDLIPHLAGNYDTTSGPKVEAKSYLAILEDINKKRNQEGKQEIQAHQVLFLTDNPLESKAAKEAGMLVNLLDRPGNNPLPPSIDVPVIKSFEDLFQEYKFSSSSAQQNPQDGEAK